MKTFLILLGLLFASIGQAQDCINCQGQQKRLATDWPIEYTKIREIDYERNSEASFCKRPPEFVDTIVLHHSETPSTDTPERINEIHLGRSSPGDPWYMIAYSYVINSPYKGNNDVKARVSEGRPMDIVGAHAGTGIMVPMDDFQKKIWADGKITCGKEGGEFTVNPKMESNGTITANAATIGLVVIGNYAPKSDTNPNGYPLTKPDPKDPKKRIKLPPRDPTEQTRELIARTSCQLQKKYPRMTNMKWHDFYHRTSCPGRIMQFIEDIKNRARKYGCKFN